MLEHLLDRLGKATLLATGAQLLLGGSGRADAQLLAVAVLLAFARPASESTSDAKVAASFAAALAAALVTTTVATLRGLAFMDAAYAVLCSMLATSAFVEWRLLWTLSRGGELQRAST